MTSIDTVGSSLDEHWLATLHGPRIKRTPGRAPAGSATAHEDGSAGTRGSWRTWLASRRSGNASVAGIVVEVDRDRGACRESAAPALGVETAARVAVAVDELRVLAHAAEDTTRVDAATSYDLRIRERLHGSNLRHPGERDIGRTSHPALGRKAATERRPGRAHPMGERETGHRADSLRSSARARSVTWRRS